jgi:hypothetical protein
MGTWGGGHGQKAVQAEPLDAVANHIHRPSLIFGMGNLAFECQWIFIAGTLSIYVWEPAARAARASRNVVNG